MYGRSIIYRASFVFFFAFTWPVSFPPNIGEHGEAFMLCACDSNFSFYVAVFLVFRWLTGLSGAAFLSVAGGSVSDMFHNQHVAK